MAEQQQQRRFFDVWIIESNTVYKEVPFTVVADWAQQGRILEDDQLRPSGTNQWVRLDSLSAFSAYLPKPEPLRAQDQAEALEPVQTDFTWRRRPDHEDDDVDMIPLIDISLVLLIFFIMTTTGAMLADQIQTPQTYFASATSSQEIIWIGIDLDKGNPVYSLGMGERPPVSDEDKNLPSMERLLQRLDKLLESRDGLSEVNIKAHEDLPSGIVRSLTLELGKKRNKIFKVYAGVRDKDRP